MVIDAALHPWLECLTDGAAWCNRCDDRADNCLQPPTAPIPLEDWLVRLRLFVVQHADCREGRGDVE